MDYSRPLDLAALSTLAVFLATKRMSVRRSSGRVVGYSVAADNCVMGQIVPAISTKPGTTVK
jgi:hypothetical protein